jgi:hypothetical protein
MTKLDAIQPLDDRFIDRIVDGTLTPAELRGAIELLDREPDGWKRCALTFMEAQCWRESFRTLPGQAGSSLGRQSLALPSSARAVNRAHRWLRGPIAAGIVAAAFAMGWMGHAAWPRPGAKLTPMAQSDTNRNPPRGGSQSETVQDTPVGFSQPTHLAARQTVEDRSLPAADDVIRPVGRLRIGTDDTGTDVPILAGPGITEQWLRNQPAPLTEHGQVALQRQGYQVDQRRQLITTILADGRRVTVPIDQVQIRYTGIHPL